MWEALVADHCGPAPMNVPAPKCQFVIRNFSLPDISKKRELPADETVDCSNCRKIQKISDAADAADGPLPEIILASVGEIQVDNSEVGSVDLLLQSVAVRSKLPPSKEPSKWEAYIDSVRRDSETLVPEARSAVLAQLCEFLTLLSREKSPYTVALCLNVLELHLLLDANDWITVADTLCTDHAPSGVVNLFISVLCVVKFRSLKEVCNRSLYKVFDVVCKRKPAIISQCFLLSLVAAFVPNEPNDKEDRSSFISMPCRPGSPQYELCQRLVRQFFANDQNFSNDLLLKFCSENMSPFVILEKNGWYLSKEPELDSIIHFQKVLYHMYCTEAVLLFSSAIPKSVFTFLAVKGSQHKTDVDILSEMKEHTLPVFRMLSFILTKESFGLERFENKKDGEITDKYTMRLCWDNDTLKLVSVILGMPACLRTITLITFKQLVLKITTERSHTPGFLINPGVSSLLHLLVTKYPKLAGPCFEELNSVLLQCVEAGASTVVKNTLAVLKSRQQAASSR